MAKTSKSRQLWQYESDISNVDIAYNFQEDIYNFEEDDNELDTSRYLSWELKMNETKKNKMLRKAAVGTSKILQFFPFTNSMTAVNESPSENESESENNEGITESKKKFKRHSTAYLHSVKFKVNPEMVKSYVEQKILPQLNQDVYIDGHERPNWHDEGCEFRTFLRLSNGEKEHVWVTHDETTFHAYDRPHAVWCSEKEQPLKKKGLGLGIHVSDFMMETIGLLKDEEEEAHVTIVLSAHYDGFWDTEKLH
ncbi:20396_t:CDS:2 [Cetraspora pellucida]|uniref:20396_t:CDS:1 n=1 Tax=Cetraspora pellucida TaxID=1433469 RepID=A0A9N8ZYD5_9GLOM|nr:20396_t:CDS:2 [Cetraspora pellucida]